MTPREAVDRAKPLFDYFRYGLQVVGMAVAALGAAILTSSDRFQLEIAYNPFF